MAGERVTGASGEQSAAFRLRLAWERFKLAVSETLLGVKAGKCNATSPEDERCILSAGHAGSHIPKRGSGWAWG